MAGSPEQFPRPKPGLAAHWQPYAERNQIFSNTGQAFRDVSHNNPALSGHFTVAPGWRAGTWMAMAALDLLVNAIGERARLLRNVARERGNWVAVRAIDPQLRRDAVGAVVAVKAGGKERVQVVSSSEGFLSAGSAGRAFRSGAGRVYRGVRGHVAGWFARDVSGGRS